MIEGIFLLKMIRDYFGVGSISINKNSIIYSIDSVKDMDVVISHFDNYPLITQK